MQTSYPRQDIKVLLLEGVSASAVESFHRAGYSQVDIHAKSLPEAELKARIADAHIVGIRSRTQLSEDVLAHAKRLIAVGCFCIGTNQVDLTAARKHCVASRRRTRCAIAAAGPNRQAAATKPATKYWASSATAISAPRLACSPRGSVCG